MRNLNKRYKRGIMRNLSFYVSLFFLTAVTVLMFLLFSTSVKCEEKYVTDFFERNCVEDGQFRTYLPLTDDNIESLNKEYGVQIEKQLYTDKEEDDYTVRVFKKSHTVDKYEIVDGKDAVNIGEICLSVSFAEANDISIGDGIDLGGSHYTVTGFCERPDYLFMIRNQTDSYRRAASFGLAVVDDDTFDSFEDTEEYYAVIYSRDNEEEFRKHIYENYSTTEYITAETNHRITTPQATIDQFAVITDMILPVLLLLVVAIIAVVLGRKVYSEQKYIGTLTALGYRKSEIIIHYTLYSLVPGLAGEIIGLLLTFTLVKFIAGAFFSKLESLPVEYTISWQNVVLVSALPVTLYMLTSFITVRKILRISVVDMLSGNNSSRRTGGAFAHSSMNFRRKFRFRAILNNKARTFVVVAGVLVSGLVMAVSVIMNDSCKNYGDKVIDKMGSFEYEYFLDSVYTDDIDGGEKMLSVNFEVEGSENNIILFGTSEKNSYLNFEPADGSEVRLSDGYYVSSMASVIFGVKKGDKMELRDICSMEKYTVEIAGVIENKAQSVLYSSEENVRNLLDIEDGGYNLIMSEKDVASDDSRIMLTIKKEDMKDMIQNVISSMKMMVYIMFIFGMIICAIVIYLMVNMIIEENSVTISMLKVLGYHSGEINKITVNIYHILIPLGIILSLLGGWVINSAYFEASTASFQAYIPSYASPMSILIFSGAVTVSYIVSLWLLGEKVKKVNMTDSLKGARE